MPTVVNLKKMVADDWLADTLYIGRPGKLADKMFTAHPEMRDGSALGNPFHRDVEDCLLKYRRWLDARIRPRDDQMKHQGIAVRAALSSIREGTLLVCWCKPGPCHGDIVLAAWEWYRRETNGSSA